MKPHLPLLRLAQLGWVLLAVFSIGKFSLSEVLYYQGIEQVCTLDASACHDAQLATAADVAQLRADGLSPQAWALGNIAYRTALALVFIAVALLIFAKKRNDGAALFISIFLVMIGTTGGFVGFLGARFPEYAVLLNLMQFPALLAFPLFFYSFPNGRVVPRALWLAILLWLSLFAVDYILPNVDKNSAAYAAYSNFVWITMFLTCAGSQIYRYIRMSNADERRQTKWVLYAAMLIVLLTLVFFSVPGLNDLTSNKATYSLPMLVVFAVVNLQLSIVPIAIGVAIFKYRLYDIDLIIRRTLIYGALSALLLLLYFGGVVVLQQLFRGLTGQGQDLAIILSTLAIAAMFGPLRHRVQRTIDRRFYRSKYDARRVLETFAVAARDEVDLSRLTDNLMGVVEETMQPEGVSVWLRKG